MIALYTVTLSILEVPQNVRQASDLKGEATQVLRSFQ